MKSSAATSDGIELRLDGSQECDLGSRFGCSRASELG